MDSVGRRDIYAYKVEGLEVYLFTRRIILKIIQDRFNIVPNTFSRMILYRMINPIWYRKKKKEKKVGRQKK